MVIQSPNISLIFGPPILEGCGGRLGLNRLSRDDSNRSDFLFLTLTPVLSSTPGPTIYRAIHPIPCGGVCCATASNVSRLNWLMSPTFPVHDPIDHRRLPITAPILCRPPFSASRLHRCRASTVCTCTHTVLHSLVSPSPAASPLLEIAVDCLEFDDSVCNFPIHTVKQL